MQRCGGRGAARSSAAADVRSKFGADVGLAAVAPVPSEDQAPGAVFLGVDIQGNARAEVRSFL
jgi:hypothetical protein